MNGLHYTLGVQENKIEIIVATSKCSFKSWKKSYQSVNVTIRSNKPTLQQAFPAQETRVVM